MAHDPSHPNRPRPARSRGLLPPDMTPMAGIGFLLVAFFLMSMVYSRPTVMQLAMPVKPKPADEFTQSDCGCGGGVMTVLPAKNQEVFYYWGLNSADNRAELHHTSFGATGLRQVLLQFRAAQGKCGIVLIKPTDEAGYQSLVDALDEMKITDQRRYAVVDLTEADRSLLTSGPL